VTVLDWLIVAVIGVSTVVSLFRGFVREAISLGAWIAALIIASSFTAVVAEQFADTLQQALLRHVLVFFLLFVATLIVGAIINAVVGKLVSAVGLGGLDRALGMVFGVLRGAVITIALLAVADAVLPQDQLAAYKRDSHFLPHAELLLQWTKQNFGELMERPLTLPQV
jgi:membrane protein required for colicin V production